MNATYLRALDDPGPRWIDGLLPEPLTAIRFLDLALWQWLGLALIPAMAWIGGVALGSVILGAAAKVTRRTQARWDDRLLREIRGPVRALLTLLLLSLLVRALALATSVQQVIDGLLQTTLIVSSAWLGLRMIRFISGVLADRLADGDRDEAIVRGNQTRVNVLRRIADVLLILVAGALILIQFDVVRQVGVSLLASAGIAGVMLGFAAQRSIATLLAGLQLSVSQPVRIGDTVIVEGEWGTIEEITLTYVVVKIWDLRRLVVPITYFLEKPFQNWTRTSPELLGTIVVHADYRVPVDKVRAEVKRLCESDPNWDRKVAGLIVLDATERTVALRALISAEDAGKQWDLRCSVREGLIKFLQQLDGGRYLPRTRLEVPEGGAPTSDRARPARAVLGPDA